MKKWIVYSPVRLVIWSRIECLRTQFDIIKKVKPRVLFIQSDGGRNEEEQKIIDKNREYIEQSIDWNCEIHKLYFSDNLGFYTVLKKVEDYIWDRVDRCIFLEDDTLPTESFFYFCDELLERYKDDTRIGTICGMNHLGIYSECDSDYFFSRQGSIWGTATWKRTYLNRKCNYVDSEYTLGLLKERTRHNKLIWKRLIKYANCGIYDGHPAGDEFWIEFDVYGQNQLQIVPKYNLTKNVGFDGTGLNTARYKAMANGFKKIFNMQTYDLNFPIKHPQYVMPDVRYEKKRNRIMAHNMPVIALVRKVEHGIRELIWGKGIDFFKEKMHVTIQK